MDIITGYRGEPHITAEQDRSVNQGTFGEGSYVLDVGEQLRAEIASNTEIRIYDGVISHQGCTARIRKNAYDSVTIANGSQGMKRKDLVVARYTLNEGNGIESIDWVVIQGTPSASAPELPEPTLGDIQAGDTVADMAMYEVDLDGINITAIVKLFDVHSFASSAEKVAYDNDQSGLNAENVQSAIDELLTLLNSVKDIVSDIPVIDKGYSGAINTTYNSTGTYTVEFNKKFTETPYISVILNNSNPNAGRYIVFSIDSINTERAVVRWRNTATSSSGTAFSAAFRWMAVGA